jgi:c-di-GMP-binding flagellar brake protein YcgR
LKKEDRMSLKVNQSVSFFSRSTLFCESIPAVVKEIRKDSILLISSDKDRFIPLNSEICVFFTDEESSYAFTCKSLVTKETSKAELVISKPDKFIRIKKRGFKRIPLDTDGKVVKAEERNPVSCRIIDVSEGGAKIHAQSFFNIQDFVKLDMEISGKTFRNMPGRVRWKKDLSEKTFQYGIEFELVSSVRRNELHCCLNRIHLCPPGAARLE